MQDPKLQLETLKRGAAEIISEQDLLAKLERSYRTGKPLTVKLGLDPSAPDIHLGHAVVLRKLKEFQDFGHEVVLVVGDFTGRIGDPTGRSKARRQLSEEEVVENAKTYKEQAFKILDPERTRVVFNSEWLSRLTFEEVIILASKYTVARMLEREEFRRRFEEEEPIYIHEFFYPFMQGYDSVALHADVELGATEQKFNILMGRTLQPDYGQEPQVALLMPILVGTDGVQKMSKSLGNYIGVQEPPEEIYGKAMSIPDEAMENYYTLATDFSPEEIKAIMAGLAAGTIHPRDAKRKLARRLVEMYHGSQAAMRAEEQFDSVFARGEIPENVPQALIPASELKDGRIWAPKLLVMSGLAATNSEARRLIEGGGVKLCGVRLGNPNEDVAIEEDAILQVGKRKFCRIKITGK